MHDLSHPDGQILSPSGVPDAAAADRSTVRWTVVPGDTRENIMIYFAYDLTMDELVIHQPHIAPGAILAGNGYLLNRRLVFSGESGTVPVAVPSYGDRVYGVLYFVSDPAEIDALKRLRYPLLRRVTRVRTLPHHRIVFAVTFEAEPEATLFEGQADREYRDHMVKIARIRDFPREYIEFLETFPAHPEPSAVFHGE